MSVRELAIVLLAMLALPVAAAPLPGAVTGIAETPDGGATVTGWACRSPGTAAPWVRVSAGGPRSPGQSVAAVTADRPAPSGAGPCGSGTAQGFAAPLNHADLFRYGGLPVSVTISGQQLAGGRRLPAWRVVGDVPRTCTVRDLESLRSCFAQADVYDRFVFTADVSCAGAACCKQPDLPPMELLHARRKLIEGNGHVLRRRQGGQFACPALLVLQSDEIVVDGLGFDEDAQAAPCDLASKPCAPTLRVQSSHNVRLTGLRVQWGKGYVVQVWDTDGFAFIDSVIADAGIIGLYVGHFRYGPSRNIVVAGSVIARSRTGGLALQGADAASTDSPVLVTDSIFSGNHWHGLWSVPHIANGITTGGQVLIADGHNVRLTGNIVANGACGNCWPPHQTVAAIELGDGAPSPAGVYGLTIDHNALTGGMGDAIHQDAGTTVTGVVLADNLVTGYRALGTVAAPHASSANLVLGAPQLLPRADLAPSPGLDASADPLVWCAVPARPADGRLVAADACRAPEWPLALLGYAR